MYDGNLEIDVEMTEIVPGKLYLGGVYDAADRKQIDKFKIEAIVNVASFQGQPTHGKVHRTIHLHDGPGNEQKDFDNAVELLESFQNAGLCTLVHCHAGVSRSPTVVAAYLAKKNNVDFYVAVAQIRLNRQIVKPHPELIVLAKRHLKEEI
jgi:protein-tyrosine phosphatase